MPECWRGFSRQDLLRRHHQTMHQSTSGVLPSRRRTCKYGEAGTMTGIDPAVGSMGATRNAVTYVEAVPKMAPASTPVEYGLVDYGWYGTYVDSLCSTAEHVQSDMPTIQVQGGIPDVPHGLPELETPHTVFDDSGALIQTAGLLLPTSHPVFGLDGMILMPGASSNSLF